MLLGEPGSGKSTQAGFLSEQLNIPHISTGNIFRDAISENSELGKLATSYISVGNLVPDDVTIKLIKHRLSQPDCKNGFILDGFPRTLDQAYALEKITDLDLVLHLTIKLEQVIDRMANRRVCSSCKSIYNLKIHNVQSCTKCSSELKAREDDTESIVRHRFEIANKTLGPIVEYYKAQGILKNIEFKETVEEIKNQITEVVGKG